MTEGFYKGDLPSDFFIEVGKGNVPGHELLGFETRNPAVGQTFEDLWGAGGELIYPTAAETWEIVSDDANDTDGGTGARTAVVVSLNADLLRQVTFVALDGTTPVTMSNTHLRPQQVLLVSAGSNGTNFGTITVRQQGGGPTRNVILPGLSISFDGHFTVPSDKRVFLIQTFTLFPKDSDGQAQLRLRNVTDPDSPWLTTSLIPLYQNIVTFQIKALFPVGSSTDIITRGRTTTGSADVVIILELLIIDADLFV